MEEPEKIVFYAIGDWGSPGPEILKVAKSMDDYSRNVAKPDFVLALGDNFYPSGVPSVQSKRFDTQWRDIFLHYENLKVKWYVILGNHDYQDDPEAQIEYTNSSRNEGNFWHLPSKCYTFSSERKSFSVDFFGLDTNGAQNHVQHSHPNQPKLLKEYKKWLSKELKSSTKDWKIVFGHHPLYTKGKSHGVIGDCLRDDVYLSFGMSMCGYGFESVFQNENVDCYFSGHEHIFQHHKSGEVNHFVCGASSEQIGFYGGVDQNRKIDWFDESRSHRGFCVAVITQHSMEVSFVNTNCEVIYSTTITKK